MEINGVMQKFIDETVEERMLESIKQERAIAIAEAKAKTNKVIANLLNSTNLTKSEIAANFEISLQEVETIASQNNSTRPTI